MEISYEINLDDMMCYQEELFLSKQNPSIMDSVKRWERLSFVLLVLFFPGIVYLICNSWLIALTALFAAILVFIWLKSNGTELFWKSYKEKAKKDLIATYFNDNEKNVIAYTLKILPEELEIKSEFSTKSIKKNDIQMKKKTDKYVFLYTIKHDATYIPFDKLSGGEKELKTWLA